MNRRTINRRYQVLKRISKSNMSIVYKIRDLSSNKILVLKSSHPCFDRSSRQALSKEHLILSRCKHPNIVEVFHFDLAGEGSALLPGTLFFTMEYLQGRTLDQLNNLSHRDLGEVLFQICDALSLIHSSGFVYGDLKPHNIMCLKHDGEINVKLFDFGLVVREGHHVNGREISGTISYVAPEMFRGGRIDRRTDLYSLGVMLYELTTGIPPFPRKDIISIAQGHLFETPLNPADINPAIPQRFSPLILRLLQKDPDQRFQNIDDIIFFLKQTNDQGCGSSSMNAQKEDVKKKAGRNEFLKISEKPSPSAFNPPGLKGGYLFSFKD